MDGSGEREGAIEVSEAWCKRCGICVAFCPTKVFEVREDGLPLVVRWEDCIWCGLCEIRCPDFAITLRPPAARERRRLVGRGTAAAGK